ncbi:hypothetical protein Y1Q_0014043 [Alligator mississippiensis]|uniref:Uncharacterized protein n=1 Tax=Alligator mississippiensis TaxID=8496 RepID=A0A151PDG6_ALLMI|nr:hypothetical protein Y1Q_0014043 [Alligator mississippiensis]
MSSFLRVLDQRFGYSMPSGTSSTGKIENTAPWNIRQGAVDRQRRGGRPWMSWTTSIKDWMGLKLTDCTRSAKD